MNKQPCCFLQERAKELPNKTIGCIIQILCYIQSIILHTILTDKSKSGEVEYEAKGNDRGRDHPKGASRRLR
jgi:hypothetical protein